MGDRPHVRTRILAADTAGRRNLIAVDLAGVAVEARCGGDAHAARVDHEHAHARALELTNSAEAATELLAQKRIEADELVTQHWAAIQLCSEALRSCGELQGFEIDEVIEMAAEEAATQ